LSRQPTFEANKVKNPDSPAMIRVWDTVTDGNGVRSLLVMCFGCRHEVILNVDRYPGDLLVRKFGPRMVCTKCGMVGADARPNWKEREK
jgi:hypothetical protein